jgi:hypothetical protein
MLSCPQSLGGLALLLIRALSFLHGSIHLILWVAHTRRDGMWRDQRKGCKGTNHPGRILRPVVLTPSGASRRLLLIDPARRRRAAKDCRDGSRDATFGHRTSFIEQAK